MAIITDFNTNFLNLMRAIWILSDRPYQEIFWVKKGFWCKHCVKKYKLLKKRDHFKIIYLHFITQEQNVSKGLEEHPFKWKQFSGEIILWGVRWYCLFALSYRDLVIMVEERGMSVNHTTIMRWVHEYAPQFKKRMKKFLKTTNDSYRVDETYIKIKGVCRYLYRAIDSSGNTLDWMLSEKRDQKSAENFFRKILKNNHVVRPRFIGVDKNAAYPPAFETMRTERRIGKNTKLRPIKYLNNIIEQDHRFLKKRIKYSQGLQTFETAQATIEGYESMHMIRKGQIEHVGRNDIIAQKKAYRANLRISSLNLQKKRSLDGYAKIGESLHQNRFSRLIKVKIILSYLK